MKKLDRVILKKYCDSGYLDVGDKGTVVSEVFEDNMVAVSFDDFFEDSHDCDGLVPHGYGWFVKIDCLETID